MANGIQVQDIVWPLGHLLELLFLLILNMNILQIIFVNQVEVTGRPESAPTRTTTPDVRVVTPLGGTAILIDDSVPEIEM